MEILVGAAAVALVSAAAARARRSARQRASADPPRAAGGTGLAVGDVVLRGAAELWLTGALELDEDGTRIVLFRASDGAQWIVQLDERGRELAVAAASSELPEGSIPDRLPIQGRTLSLRRRGRARARFHGELTGRDGPALVTVLAESGRRVLVAVDLEGAPRLALVGERVDRAELDVLPGRR